MSDGPPLVNSSSISPLEEGKSEDVFEVEKIIGYKEVGSDVYAKVRWLGYEEKDDTWEPFTELFETAKETVEEFFSSLKYTEQLKLLESAQRGVKKWKESQAVVQSSNSSGNGSNEDEPAVPEASAEISRKEPRRLSPGLRTPQTVQAPRKVKRKISESSSYGPPETSKRSTKEVRDTRHWIEDDFSDDDNDGSFPSETSGMDRFARMVKVRISPRKDSSYSSQPSSSFGSLTNPTAYTVTTCNGFEPILTRPKSSLIVPLTSPDDNTEWIVTGIVRHTDSSSARKKLVMMQHKVTLESRVLEDRDAFELDGWALTKFLLDRCEF